MGSMLVMNALRNYTLQPLLEHSPCKILATDDLPVRPPNCIPFNWSSLLVTRPLVLLSTSGINLNNLGCVTKSEGQHEWPENRNERLVLTSGILASIVFYAPLRFGQSSIVHDGYITYKSETHVR